MAWSPSYRSANALLVAVAVPLSAALVLTPLDAEGASLDLPRAAMTSVDVALAAVRPVARPLVDRLSGLVSIDDRVRVCRPPSTSCSYAGTGTGGRWGIHLDRATTAFTYPSNRFLVYHELGHADWGLLLGAAGRRAFANAVSRALRGRQCVDDEARPCAALPEVFADEFARYVGGFGVSMSSYRTPPLLDAATFGAVVGGGGQANPRPLQEYLWRPAYVRGDVVSIRIRADAANVREDRGIVPEREGPVIGRQGRTAGPGGTAATPGGRVRAPPPRRPSAAIAPGRR